MRGEQRGCLKRTQHNLPAKKQEVNSASSSFELSGNTMQLQSESQFVCQLLESETALQGGEPGRTCWPWQIRHTWGFPAFSLPCLAVEPNAGAHGQRAPFKDTGQPVTIRGKFADDLLLLLDAGDSSLKSAKGWPDRGLPACREYKKCSILNTVNTWTYSDLHQA